MKPVVVLLLLSGFTFQDSKIEFVPGEPGSKRWPISGRVALDEGTELNLRGRRLERRWDSHRKLFTESLSDGMIRSSAVVRSGRFDGNMRAGTPGRYGVTLATETKLLHSEKVALGSVEPMFSQGPEDIKEFLDILKKAQGFVDEIERISSSQTGNSEKDRQDYLKRVSEVTTRLDALFDRSDFTGTVNYLREAFNHIRSANIWDEGPPPPGGDDPHRALKKVFTDMDLTIEMLRKRLALVPEILSTEIKVSATLILERLLAQAGEHEKRKETSRAVALAASKMAEAAPVPDKELVRLFDKASDPSTDIPEVREELRRTGIAFVVQ